MNFLKWYSLVVVMITVVLSILGSGDEYELIGGLMFAPVAVYLWMQVAKKNDTQAQK